MHVSTDNSDRQNSFNWKILRQRVDGIGWSMAGHLSDEAIESLLRERAERFSCAVREDVDNLLEVIVFEQRGIRYALPLTTLAEIRPMQRLTSLPKVPSAIMGVINVRGRIVAIYSLGEWQVEYNKGISGSALIGCGAAASIALHADTVLGTEKVPVQSICTPPVSISSKPYISGIGGDGLVFLDLEKFFLFHRHK